MEIVRLDNDYLDLIKKKNSHYPEKGLGIKIYENDKFFYIPLTSQKKYQNMKKKNFDLGNKRTAFIIANKLLIRAGKGILLLDENNFDEFSFKLHQCYKDKENRSAFLKFIQEHCIKY